jgi:predicted RNase H-like HicB family nuclease
MTLRPSAADPFVAFATRLPASVDSPDAARPRSRLAPLAWAILRSSRQKGWSTVDTASDSEALTIELEQEVDGRWLAEVLELPGVLAYGSTPEEARARVETLTLRVLAERLERGEPVPQLKRFFKAA